MRLEIMLVGIAHSFKWRRGRWGDVARWFGPLSLLLCPLLLAAYLAWHHGVQGVVALKAVAALYFLCFAPGYAVMRYVFGIRRLRGWQQAIASFVLGVVVTPPVWYLLRWVNWEWLFVPTMVLLGVALFWHGRWIRLLKCRRLVRLVRPGDGMILWLALGLAVLWSYSMTVVEFKDGEAHIMPYRDHASHFTVINELGRAMPLEALPFVAGATGFGYHLMPDVWCDMIRHATGTDSQTAYFFIALTIRYIFFSMACYLSLLPRFGRAAAFSGVLVTLAAAGSLSYAVGMLKTVMFSNWLLHYLHCNYPAAFGLSIVFMIIFLVSLKSRVELERRLFLVSFLSGLLLWYKANLTLAVAPAVALLVTITLWRRRAYGWWAACAGMQCGLAALRQLELSQVDCGPALIFQPGAFLAWWWDRLVAVLPGWPMDSLIGDGQAVELLSAPWQWLAVLIICCVSMFHVGLVAVPYLFARCGVKRFGATANGGDLLCVLILVITVLGWMVFPVQELEPGNISFALRVLVCAVVFPICGVMLWGIVNWARSRGRLVTAVVAASVGVCCVADLPQLEKSALWHTRYRHDVVSRGFYDCCRYIRDNAADDAVVIQPRPDSPWTVGLLTQRRIVLEMEQLWRDGFFNTIPLLADVKHFFSTADPALARRIVERYGVDYVVADTRSSELPDGEWLEVVYRSGDSVVMRVCDAVESGARASLLTGEASDDKTED